MKSATPLAIALTLAPCACALNAQAEPSFDWCGELLCDWTLEAGRIERAPTWHEQDYGAKMLDPPVVIATRTSLYAGRCTRFGFVGNVDAEAQLVLELYPRSEGPLEYEETIPETRWQAQTFIVPPIDVGVDNPLAGVLGSLKLHKRGAGTVVLARLELESIACDSASAAVE